MLNLEKDINANLGKYVEAPWTIIESYFKDQHLSQLVRHQLESYNDFVNNQIQKTIDMFNPVRICSENDVDKDSGKYKLEIFVTFENFHLYRPQIHENNGASKLMFPQEARLRNFTYASMMTIDLNIKYIVRSGDNLENSQTFYKNLPTQKIAAEVASSDTEIKTLTFNMGDYSSRYIKIVAKNLGDLPPWHLGALHQGKAWVFIDEITIK